MNQKLDNDMKKDYTLYVISRIANGPRGYLMEDLNTFSDEFNKARFFDSKKDALFWLKSAMTYSIFAHYNDLHIPKPIYELLSVKMKINKEEYQL